MFVMVKKNNALDGEFSCYAMENQHTSQHQNYI